jgi:regulator of sirC expression with transglutaminase-like and TPR domain
VTPVERFAALVAGPAPDLDVAALVVASGADPALDIARWLAELDRLAEGIADLDGLIHRLFVEEGFTGNTRDYYDPRNSLLHEVLGRRLGIPITLSIVCMEVGRRCGVPLLGIGMPGHFLVQPAGEDRYLDAFAGGALLDLAACEARFRASTGAGPLVAFGAHLLQPVPTSAILTRLLETLRAIYRRRGDAIGLEWTLRMRLALPRVTVADVVELGQALGRQGRWLDGATLLERRAEQHPEWAATLRPAAKALRAVLN